MKKDLEDYLQLANDMIKNADTMYEAILANRIINHINYIKGIMYKYIEFKKFTHKYK